MMSVFLLIFLFIVLMFPSFLFPLILIFGSLFLFYIPFRFTLNSIHVLLTAPKQFYLIATNRALRRNHALEHATINVLQERYGPRLPVAGYADKDGFFIRGNCPTWEVESAAIEGLARLRSGESNLAIHRQCGTTLLVANIIAALLFFAFLFLTGHFSIWYMLFAIILSNFFGPPLGILLQRFITTSAAVDDMVVQGIEFRSPDQSPTDLWMFVRTALLINY